MGDDHHDGCHQVAFMSCVVRGFYRASSQCTVYNEVSTHLYNIQNCLAEDSTDGVALIRLVATTYSQI